MRKFHSLQLLLLLLMIFFCISILFDTIVETHPTETKKEIWKKLREREPLGRAKCKSGLQDCWVLNKWSLWKECCVWEGKGKEKKQPEENSRQASRKAGRQAGSGRSEGIKS